MSYCVDQKQLAGKSKDNKMRIIKAIILTLAGVLAAHGGSLPMGYTALDYIEATAK